MFPDNADDSVDLAHVFAGGRVVVTSDQHFGVGSNLLLPGRGETLSPVDVAPALIGMQARIWVMVGKPREAE